MTNKKSTKSALLLSALSLLLCVSMLVGSTFAWFTDSVTSAGNVIRSGTLDVDLVDENGNSLEGKVLKFVDQDDNDLWEPGCTYTLQNVYVKNNGNLALKYEVVINGIDGDAKLLEAIEWTVTVDNTQQDLSKLNGNLKAGETSKAIALTGHMIEEAGNEYQNLTVEGISISVYATQDTVESDSFDNQYDANAYMFVSSTDGLKTALAEGKNVMLTKDLEVDSNTAINVPAGTKSLLDLNGKTIRGVATNTGSNFDMFLVKGELTVVGGTVEMFATQNQAWDKMTAVFDVTAGGVLNIKDATVKNLGGTDMGIAVHLNNWGEVTLNVDNSTIFANYCAVRVFNSGNDMNNVTITNSNLLATRSFWVHNYTAGDFGGSAEKAAAAAARLNMNVLVDAPITGLAADDATNLNAAANNTFSGSISYGFNNRQVYYSTTKSVAAPSDAASLKAALEAGSYTVLADDVVVNEKISVPAGKDITLDLNGKTLAGAFTNKGSSALIENNGTITITNGTVVSLAECPDTDWGTEGFPTYATNTISNRGNLVIGEGAVIENQTNQGGASYAVDNYAGATLTVNDGATIIAKDVAIRMFSGSATSENKVVINGGTITGKRAIWIQLPSNNSAVAPKTTVEINGGSLNSTSNLTIYSYSYGNSFAQTNVTITGGTFSGDVAFGGGYKGDQETVTVTGGTFNGELGRYLANDGWADIAKP